MFVPIFFATIYFYIHVIFIVILDVSKIGDSYDYKLASQLGKPFFNFQTSLCMTYHLFQSKNRTGENIFYKCDGIRVFNSIEKTVG